MWVGGGGGYSGFQVTGVIVESLGFKFSIPGFLTLGRKLFEKYLCVCVCVCLCLA